MFSSPAPRATPRKSVYRSNRGDTASVISRGTPSLISERDQRELGTPSVRSSRVNALKRAASPTSTAGETTRTARYDDGYGFGERVYWSRSESSAAYAMGALPKEVQQIVKNSVTSPVGGQVDIASGYAYVTTANLCIAWNYTKRTQSSPTVYVFPAPSPSRAPNQSPPPVSAALHYTGAGEPGLILVSPTGELRLWENISAALSSVDRYQALQLELGPDDYADRIWPVDQTTYIVTTFSSQAFRLSITSSSGRLTPTVAPLTRSAGMFGRASTALFSLREDREGIAAVAVEGSNMWILAKRTAQRWALSADGQKYVQDVDLHDLVGDALFPETWSNGDVDLELNDLVCTKQNQFALLATYNEQASSSSGSYRSGASHAIVLLSSSGRSGGLAIQSSVAVSYSAPPDPRTLDAPRLLIPFDSPTAYIRLGSVIVSVSLGEGVQIEETITLKDSARNAFIGTGQLRSPLMQRPTAPLVLMPALGGLIGVEAYSPRIGAERQSTHGLATAKLKSRMEQAVFFGDRSENPLTFDLDDEIGGDVAAAAEAVSADVLACTSPLMPAIYEIRSQLSDRLTRLKDLIGFIRRNGLLSKLSQTSRRSLSRDGEKAKAAVDLWDYQNRLMDQIHTQSAQSLLADAVAEFMRQHAVEQDDDPVRLFFRTQAHHLDKLLDLVYAAFRRGSETTSGIDRTPWILEIVARAAAQYQEDELAIYEVDRQSPSTEQWTAQDSIMDALETLFYQTERLITDRSSQLGSAIDSAPTPTDTPDLRAQRQAQSTLKNQLTELAAAICVNMEDKLRAASRQMADGAEEQEGLALKRKWDELRPRVIRPLVAVDRVSHAYELAEHHTDFDTLVWLCNHPTAGAGTAKLQEYIERFGEEFAFVLYQWYIDQGQQHALLSQDEVYGGLVSKFFDLTDYPELAWLHHLACKRYGAAAADLAKVDDRDIALDAKHIISSIGKLAAVAEIKVRGGADKRRQLLIDFDDELDLIQVQETLRSALVSTATARRTPEAALQTYIAQHVTLLGTRPSLSALFGELAQKLVDGEALDVEGLVDILTLKDNKEEGGNDPAVALDRLRKDSTLPEGRKQVALMSIWLRIFIRDDWISIANTAGKSEERIQAMLRQTLTYATIQAIGEMSDFPQSYILTPYTSAEPPLLAELSARFPTRLPHEIDALMRDHQDEIALLNRYIDEAGLEDRVREVAELIKRDVDSGQEAAEDIKM